MRMNKNKRRQLIEQIFIAKRDKEVKEIERKKSEEVKAETDIKQLQE